MSDSIIIAIFHIIIAVAEFIIAVVTIISNPKGKSNRAIAFLMTLFGMTSISIGMMMSSLSGKEALPWFLIQSATLYSIGAATFLTSLIILRPKVANNKFISTFAWVFTLFPAVAILLDGLNISSLIFGKHLFISTSVISGLPGGYISSGEYGTGILRGVFLASLIGFFMLTLLYPAIYVAVKDRKSNPNNSRFAWMIVVASIVSYISSRYLTSYLPITITPLISNAAFTIGFAYIGFQKSDQRGDLAGIPTILSNFRMFHKLLTITLVVVLPAVFIISISTLTFLQDNIVNLVGQELRDQAVTEALFVNREIDFAVRTLERLAADNQTQTLLNARTFDLSILSEEVQTSQLERNQNNWISQGEQSPFSINLLSPPRNSQFTNFVTFEINHDEVTLVDSIGGLVTASSRPENYDFRNDPTWQTVVTTNSVHVSDPQFHGEDDHLSIDIGIPIFNNGSSTDLQGALISHFDISDLNLDINMSDMVLEDFTVLYTSTGEYIQIDTDHVHQSPELDLDIIDESKGELWRVIRFNQEDSILSWSRTNDVDSNSYIDWIVITHANKDLALNPINSARNISLILTILVLIGSVGITVTLAKMITDPLEKLTESAEKIQAGDFGTIIESSSTDEIGILAASIQSMAQELNQMITGLEGTVDQRTADLERRAVQMETSSEVAREAASILDLQELLDRVTLLISDRFNFYHTGIFLLDDRAEYAVLQSANSPGGKRMLARGHKLQVGKVGVVGYSAGMGEPRVAQDVGADVIYYDNPDMPNTRSELALPLTVRDKVIGVLDVQSGEENAFSREDVQVLQLLSDQIALAIENARLLQGSKKALKELEYLYGQEALSAWQEQISSRDIAFNYNPIGLEFATQTHEDATLPEDNELMSKQIKFKGQVIGALDLARESEVGGWSEDEEALVEEILEQTALALENARLVSQIRLRSGQIQLLQQITSFASSLPEENKLLNFIATKLFGGLRLNNVSIERFDREGIFSTIVASSPYQKMVDISVPIQDNEITLEMIRTQELTIIYDISNNPSIEPELKETLVTRGTNTWVILPLTARGGAVGAINLEIADPDRPITEEDINLFNQISSQVSTALEGSRLFNSEQQGRQSAAALLEITQIASSSLDLNYVLKEVTQRSALAVQANRCTIFMVDQFNNQLNPLMTQFADPNKKDDLLQGHFNDMHNEKIDDLPFFMQIIEHKQPNVYNVLTQDNNLFPKQWLEPFNSAKILAVPLISKNQIIGLMAYDHENEQYSFTQANIDLAQTIAGQVATTIENANLFEETVSRAERERLVAEITTKMRNSNDPDAIMETALAGLRQALNPNQDLISNSQASLDIQENGNHINGKPSIEIEEKE